VTSQHTNKEEIHTNIRPQTLRLRGTAQQRAVFYLWEKLKTLVYLASKGDTSASLSDNSQRPWDLRNGTTVHDLTVKDL